MTLFSLLLISPGCGLFERAPPEDVPAAVDEPIVVTEAEGTFGTGTARLVLRDGVLSMYATDADGVPIEPEGGVIAMYTPVEGLAERLLLQAAGDHWEAPTRADGSPAFVVVRWETAERRTVGSVTIGELDLKPKGRETQK